MKSEWVIHMNYKKKLLRTYLIIVLFFTTVITTLLFFGARFILQKEQVQKDTIVFDNACSLFEDRLSSLQKIIQLISSSNYARDYAAEVSGKSNTHNRVMLCNQLCNVAFATQPGCSLLVTKATDNHYCSNATTAETNDLKYGLQSLSLTEETFQSIIDSFSDAHTVETVLYPTYVSSDDDLIILATRIFFNSNYPLYIFAGFQPDKLIHTVSSENYSFSIYQGDQIKVSHSSADSERALSWVNKNVKTSLYQKDYFILGQNFTYIMTAQPVSVWNQTLLLIFSSCIVIFSLCLFAVIFITNKMYAPIQETLNQTTTVCETDNEFSEIQKNFRSLRKHMDHLELKMQDYLTPAQVQFIHDLLIGAVSSDQFENYAARYQINVTGTNFIAVVFMHNDLSSSAFAETCDFHPVHEQFMYFISQNPQLQLFHIIHISPSEQVFIFQNTDIALLAGHIRLYYDSLSKKNVSTQDILISIGSSCTNLAQIYRSYLHASDLIVKAQHSYTRENLLIYGSANSAANSTYTVYYPLNTEQTLINAVLNGKQATWSALLEALIDTNEQQNLTPVPLSFMLSTTFNRILISADIDSDIVWEQQKQLYDRLHSCKSYKELYHMALDILMQISDLLEQQTQSSSKNIRSQMLDFVHSNYTRDISLLDLADHLHLSKSYTSVLFKDVVGSNFKDYLSAYRMEKACEFIAAAKGKVRLLDIASAVGCSTSSLLYLFNRYKGMTPHEWIVSQYPEVQQH